MAAAAARCKHCNRTNMEIIIDHLKNCGSPQVDQITVCPDGQIKIHFPQLCCIICSQAFLTISNRHDAFCWKSELTF